MKQPGRLPRGGRIDRTKPVEFRFNGTKYGGFHGDTLASALLANGVSVVSRSFKYHRPRGIVAAGPDEPNAIFQLGRGATSIPNVKATQVELYDQLIAHSTKGWPSLRFDVGAVNDVFARALPAGFYNKTFIHPQRLWPVYERVIRRAAGFGTVPAGIDPDRYVHRNAHCDVLVVGGGPTGLSAARAAAAPGARVMLVDEQAEFGGRLLSDNETVDGKPGTDWAATVVQALQEQVDVQCIERATAIGYYDDNFVTVLESLSDHLPPVSAGRLRHRFWRIRARQVVLAQGAFERPLAFCNNDQPGVMLASAVRSYINRYGVLPGRNAVLFTNNDSAYAAAIDIAANDGKIIIVDSRAELSADVTQLARAAGITVMHGHIVTEAVGRTRVNAVRVAQWNGRAADAVQSSITIDCDLLLMSGGWSPAVHLHSQAGGDNVWSDALHCFVPGASRQNNRSAGSGNGVWSLDACLADGHAAGIDAAARCGFTAGESERSAAATSNATGMQPLWRVPADRPPERVAKQFIDFQNDTSVSDIRLAVREGFSSVEHVKRYTAMGFGTDQGKLGNINGMAVLAETLGKSIPDVGTTTFRPAYTPLTFAAGAGEDVGALYDPVRKTAIHPWHDDIGAPMEVVGQWWRPWYFPQPGEDIHAAVNRECKAVRESLGVMDASTLGKIDVQGADALTFLERVYTHDVGKMKNGRCAYGIMLGEDGMLMDDGVMARLDTNHFYLTTTTGGAARVFAWLERWLQTEWPDLDVRLTSTTDQWSTIALVGPRSRDCLRDVGCDISLDADDFPFMSVREATVAGIAVQLFRVSFSGELAFEINVPSRQALSMWQTVFAAGEAYGITPYGTEAMHVLRAEKGFVIVGQDTDGSVTPVDLQMNWMLSKDKDFLGKRSLQRSDCMRVDRKQLVGLTPLDETTVVAEGAQLIDEPDAPAPVPMLGHVTSSYFSACLGHPIALGLLTSGRERHGDIVTACQADGTNVELRVGSPVFYDPKGERQRV